MDGDDECIGQQSLLTFARKSDAVKAWNTRSTSAAVRGMREAILLNAEKAIETAIASAIGTSVEVVGRAIAEADGEDYMEDCERYDKRARFAIKACGLAVKP